ncbi:5-AMP-activated protein kinase, beta subunit, putative [Ixodes scapularis]|uniref:5'-AMP-activated protein kinase subunit beta-1 n=1 Tax=Ixodes scapularis TaxID=6945 RepID=B7Q9W1_IXOSC|nr:5-AMP-activated protein kinase, beta subunit, putative [Ixodes scapularis]|eukprot:XP_002406383.1 5-AMP-activated protein kinase, beta subunit, putative [Ixodes scapularis]
MGNTGSGNKRDRAFSTDTDPPSSPGKDDRAFEFTTSSSRKSRFIYQASLDDSEDFPSFRKGDADIRPRASTLEGNSQLNAPLPTVFKWEGGGKDVCISGTFTNWKPIPMVHSHGDFVVILDVPEGDHQYKFMVDGQWPTLLPEPNHVMLNHLYALSIKDGVMVLSATHRYRKKYVTTLLYKPI